MASMLQEKSGKDGFKCVPPPPSSAVIPPHYSIWLMPSAPSAAQYRSVVEKLAEFDNKTHAPKRSKDSKSIFMAGTGPCANAPVFDPHFTMCSVIPTEPVADPLAFEEELKGAMQVFGEEWRAELVEMGQPDAGVHVRFDGEGPRTGTNRFQCVFLVSPADAQISSCSEGLAGFIEGENVHNGHVTIKQPPFYHMSLAYCTPTSEEELEALKREAALQLENVASESSSSAAADLQAECKCDSLWLVKITTNPDPTSSDPGRVEDWQVVHRVGL